MNASPEDLVCPTPHNDRDHITMAHGAGGGAMHRLIQDIFAEAFGPDILQSDHDAARIELNGPAIAFTTDSYVVHPLEFPGGDIGSLAIFGTVNDLAMRGARPQWLSASFILEEGLPLDTLQRIVSSMAEAARRADVEIVTGDTKVVEHGKADGLFITTTGMGSLPEDVDLGPHRVKPGDAVLVSGDLGRHGMAVLSAREGFVFESDLRSDCAPLNSIVQSLLDAGAEVHCLRDLTRGGLASGLNEIAQSANVSIAIEEAAVPVSDVVRGGCELLGLEPLYLANEGRFVAVVAGDQADRTLRVLLDHANGANAHHLGFVRDVGMAPLVMRTALGVDRIVDLPLGDLVPRIC